MKSLCFLSLALLIITVSCEHDTLYDIKKSEIQLTE